VFDPLTSSHCRIGRVGPALGCRFVFAGPRHREKMAQKSVPAEIRKSVFGAPRSLVFAFRRWKITSAVCWWWQTDHSRCRRAVNPLGQGAFGWVLLIRRVMVYVQPVPGMTASQLCRSVMERFEGQMNSGGVALAILVPFAYASWLVSAFKSRLLPERLFLVSRCWPPMVCFTDCLCTAPAVGQDMASLSRAVRPMSALLAAGGGFSASGGSLYSASAIVASLRLLSRTYSVGACRTRNRFCLSTGAVVTQCEQVGVNVWPLVHPLFVCCRAPLGFLSVPIML